MIHGGDFRVMFDNRYAATLAKPRWLHLDFQLFSILLIGQRLRVCQENELFKALRQDIENVVNRPLPHSCLSQISPGAWGHPLLCSPLL